MAMSLPKPESCNLCGEPSHVRCKLCESTFYCSTSHQKQDWKSHQLECDPFMIVCDPSTGQTRWIATRKLHPGTLLLEEEPILVYPHWSSKRVTDDESCIVCGLNFNGTSMKMCDNCSWKLCNRNCEQRQWHVDSECRVFGEYEIIHLNGDHNSKQVSSLIGVLRGLSLKTNDPSAYEDLLSLPQQTFHSPFEHQLKMDCENMLKFLKKYMDPLELGEEEYEKVFRAVEINRIQYTSFGIVYDDSREEDSIKGSLHTNFYVYDQTSYLNHSCLPNCSFTIGPFPECKIRIRVATEVAKGQELTIIKGYDPIYRDCGTRERQLQFLRKRGILCKCPRCLDPKELGSYAAAISCLKCREIPNCHLILNDHQGYLLPSDPLDFSAEAEYKCNNCEEKMLATQVSKLEMRLHQRSEEISSEHIDPNNPYHSIDRMVKNVRTKIPELHPGHWIVTNTIRNLVAGVTPLQIIITRVNTCAKSIKYLHNCILYLNQILIQEMKISHGINPFTANLQALLGTKLAILILTFSNQLTSSEILRCYRLHKKYCLEALQYFDEDFPFYGKDLNLIADHLRKTMEASEKLLPTALEVYRDKK